MGSLLCRHAPPLSEAGSLPAPGDEALCPGFEYPAYLLLLKGSPEAPLPLLPWGETKRPGQTSTGGSTAVCDCPFPGSGPGHGCPCMEDMEERIGHTYRRVPGCVLRCVRRCEHCGKLIFCLFHKWLMCTGESPTNTRSYTHHTRTHARRTCSRAATGVTGLGDGPVRATGSGLHHSRNIGLVLLCSVLYLLYRIRYTVCLFALEGPHK